MSRSQQIWVHPKFKKKLKMMAIERNTDVTKLTRELADDDLDIGNYRRVKKKNDIWGF